MISLSKIEPHIPQLGDCKAKSVSIMIPCYEDSPKLRRTIWSIGQNCDLDVNLVVSCEKQSVAENHNACLPHLKDDIVIRMDDDVILSPCFTSVFAAILESNEQIGAVAAKMSSIYVEPQNFLFNIEDDIATLPAPPPGTCFAVSMSRLDGFEADDAYEASQFEDTDLFMHMIVNLDLAVVGTKLVWVLHENNYKNNTTQTWNANKAYFQEKWGYIDKSET